MHLWLGIALSTMKPPSLVESVPSLTPVCTIFVKMVSWLETWECMLMTQALALQVLISKRPCRLCVPDRNWRVSEGEFCGVYYTQNKKAKVINMSQKLFAERLKPASIPESASPDDLLSESQTRVLRASNGSLNWLASQSRPDLAVQTSLSQQAFPAPKIRHLRDANSASQDAQGSLHSF